MFANPHVRRIMGLFLGALAGVSLCLGVLPLVLELAGVGSQLDLSRALSSQTGIAAAILAVGGWGVARTRQPLHGPLVLGPAGVAAGVVLVRYGLPGADGAMPWAVLGGLVYGALGGLILGRLVTPPPEEGDPA